MEELKPKITQLDNLLPFTLLELSRERLLDPLLNWGYIPPYMVRDIRIYDYYQMNHVVYDADTELSAAIDVCKMILLSALNQTNRRLRTLFKIRIINSLPGPMLDTRPFIDLSGPHQTALFFPQDSDGVTTVYNERHWLQNWDLPQEFTGAVELEPRANTWYEFDGTHWRTSGRPVQAPHRVCVVFNFIADPIPEGDS